MPSIHEIAAQIDQSADIERSKYLKKLSDITNRNVICYYANSISVSN